MVGERKVWVIEWLHPNGSWHIDNDFVAPAYFSREEAERAVEIRNRGLTFVIKRRVVPYTPFASSLKEGA